MSEEISEDQLVHFFAGECGKEEAAKIEAWINADPDRKQRVARLRQIWEAAGEQTKNRPDIDAMWDNLSRRLGFPELKREEPENVRDTIQRARCKQKEHSPWKLSTFLSSSSHISTVVVSVVVLLLATWALYEGLLINRGASSMRTIATEVGERARIQLGDGTRVTLNAESKLTLPSEFGDDKRKVNLQGQAYFEVMPDEKRPFLVHTKETVTRVLGTKFDIDAYPSDEKTHVVVAKGKVTVESAHEQSESSVALTERQMASMSKLDRSMVRREVDPAPYLAWTEGQLVFRDTPFDEVRRRLRSWYGLRVRLTGSTKAVDHLNATFTDEPVGEVLSIIAKTLDLRYEQEGKTVTFFVPEDS